MRNYEQRLVAFVSLATTAILVACGSKAGGSTGPSTGGTPTNIVKVSGDSQSGEYESMIPKPLVVKVTDSVGQPVTNTSVSWLTSLFGAAQQQNITTTNAGGQTQLSPLLAGLPGTFTVSAAINGHSVTFSGTSNILLANGLSNMSAGLFATCGLTAEGVAFCWGNSLNGLLGNGTDTSHTGPVPVSGGHTFTQVSVGDFAACAVATGGALYCWGDPTYGNFGNGTAPGGPPYLTPVSAGSGMTFSSVSVGYITCGISSGVAYCWGSNTQGEDGTGDTVHHWSPAKVKLPSGVTLKSIGAGFGYACGLSTSGAAYCWGSNYNGTLGFGGSSPAQADSALLVTGGHVFTYLAVGSIAACGLTSAGSVYCWGTGLNGNGTTATEYTPTAVSMGGLSFTELSMYGPHACGLTASGAAYCWGENTDGAIGGGSFSNSSGSTPTLVTGGLTFSTILGGGVTSCGYTTSNTMYCWGGNQALELGLSPGADSMYDAPQPIPGMSGGG